MDHALKQAPLGLNLQVPLGNVSSYLARRIMGFSAWFMPHMTFRQ